MDEYGSTRFGVRTDTVKRKRSQRLRQPRTESQMFPKFPDQSPVTPLSDNVGSHESVDGSSAGRKIYSINHYVSQDSSANRFEGDYASKKEKEDGGSSVTYNSAGENVAKNSKLQKVKLKVGGVTRTFQTKKSSYGESSSSYISRPQQKLTQENPSEDDSLMVKRSVSKGTFGTSKGDTGKMPPHQNRKIKKVTKRFIPDGLDEDDEDDEMRYLDKLKTLKVKGYRDLGEESTNKRSLSRVPKVDKNEISGSDYADYEEEEPMSDERKEPSDSPIGTKKEISLTTRQRALLSSRDSSSNVNRVEFPNGLPPQPPRKQKDKLSEVEQQLKRAEALQKRKMYNEKAARESEAEAIRKILGQDSSRKKREDKLKKRQEELAQEKAAKEQMLASSTIRTVMGPTGTVVSFPLEMGLPSIFNPKPCSYPPPRQKCAGPDCKNPYKYRDSKTNLPLCSLECYKAIHEKMQD